MTVRKYEDLLVWQRAHAFVLVIYQTTGALPADERFGLTSQIRRASVSIVANIVEGSRRKSDVDFARFLNLAEGSASEIECLLLICRDLTFISSEEAATRIKEIDEIKRMLYSLRIKIAEG